MSEVVCGLGSVDQGPDVLAVLAGRIRTLCALPTASCYNVLTDVATVQLVVRIPLRWLPGSTRLLSCVLLGGLTLARVEVMSPLPTLLVGSLLTLALLM